MIWSAAWLGACGGSGNEAKNAKPDYRIKVETAITHEVCEGLDGASRKDVNGDGRPDLTVVSVAGIERCRIVDLNFDGRSDTWVYQDKAGNVRRRESDFDRDGRVDEIAVYKGGMLVAKHRATSLSGRLDTWHFYEKGVLARTERDADGDTYLDQWWEYPDRTKPECPLIHSDVDRDGRPDPGATVDLCKEIDEPEQDDSPVSALELGASSAPITETSSDDEAPAKKQEENAK